VHTGGTGAARRSALQLPSRANYKFILWITVRSTLTSRDRYVSRLESDALTCCCLSFRDDRSKFDRDAFVELFGNATDCFPIISSNAYRILSVTSTYRNLPAACVPNHMLRLSDTTCSTYCAAGLSLLRARTRTPGRRPAHCQLECDYA